MAPRKRGHSLFQKNQKENNSWNEVSSGKETAMRSHNSTRYGEIGISAVKAAAVQHRAKETFKSEVSNMTSKQQNQSGHKGFNVGQREAFQEKERVDKFRHMGESSKKSEQKQTGSKR
jgi:hypothetical protein